MDAILIFILVALLLVILFFRQKQTALDFPGPRGWPLVGCFFEMRRQNAVQLMTDWAKQYGPAYMFSVFGKRLLVASHPDTIYELLVTKGKAYGGRPEVFRIKFIFEKNGDILSIIASSDLAYNATIRKQLHPPLNTFGTRKGKLASVLKASTQLLLDSFERTDSGPFDPKESIYHAAAFTLASLLYGDNVGDITGLSQQLLDVNQVQVDVLGPGIGNLLLDFAPWLRFLPWFPPYDRVVRCKRMENEIFGAIMKRVEEVCKDQDEMTLGKALMGVVGQRYGKGNEAGQLSKDHAIMVIRDFMSAGVLTTSNTFHALLNVLQHHQDVQGRAYQEIVTGVGLERDVEMDDKENLPYNRAVVLEILRYFPVAALGVTHRTKEDTSLAGLYVPRGTEVITNLWACHHDPDLWTDPMAFQPERFLDDDGQLVPPDHTNRKQLFPFGAGTRVCVGEVLALNRLFVFLTNSLQKFHFVPPEDADATTCDSRHYDLDFLLQSASYKTRAIRRNSIFA